MSKNKIGLLKIEGKDALICHHCNLIYTIEECKFHEHKHFTTKLGVKVWL
jgi:hypothetical protein